MSLAVRSTIQSIQTPALPANVPATTQPLAPPPPTQPIGAPLTPPTAVQAGQENPNLDFLRAFAVVLVVLGHLTHFHGRLALGPLNLLLMGTLGVMLFFVHTCLVLMLSLERQWKTFFALPTKRTASRKVFFVEFMIRRIFRIYPLSMTVLAVIVVFHLPQAFLEPGHFHGFPADGGDILANLFLVQNLSMRVSLLGPMWSLPYELQMYLFLPWIFLFLNAGRSLWRVAGLWAVSVGLGLVVLRDAPNPNLVLFVPCFLPGVIAYQLQKATHSRLPGLLWPPVLVTLAGLFLAGSNGEHWFKKWAICLVLGLVLPMFRPISWDWLVAGVQSIAKYSYGIYLTHFFSVWFAFERLGNLREPLKVGVFLTLLAALPVFFYHVVEKPLIEVGKRVANRYVSQA
jgi:peptidoglycan/LPS O-acetylase OafA/YrhL